MGDLPLRTPTDRRPGGPLPRLLPNQTHPHPLATKGLCSESDAVFGEHRALIRISTGCSLLGGRLDTRYSPVRRSPSKRASSLHAAPRLACVKPVASVHPEPGSNSPLEKYLFTVHAGNPEGKAAEGDLVCLAQDGCTYLVFTESKKHLSIVSRNSRSPVRARRRVDGSYSTLGGLPDGRPPASCTTTTLFIQVFQRTLCCALTGILPRKRMQR